MQAATGIAPGKHMRFLFLEPGLLNCSRILSWEQPLSPQLPQLPSHPCLLRDEGSAARVLPVPLEKEKPFAEQSTARAERGSRLGVTLQWCSLHRRWGWGPCREPGWLKRGG